MIKLELTEEEFEIVYKGVFHNLKRMREYRGGIGYQKPELMEAYKAKVESLFIRLGKIRKKLDKDKF